LGKFAQFLSRTTSEKARACSMWQHGTPFA